MKEHVIRVKRGSTDEVRVRNWLESHEIEVEPSSGVDSSIYFRFRAEKKLVKQMKKDLNLIADSVYYTFKELVKD